jgi:hypothetical protein
LRSLFILALVAVQYGYFLTGSGANVELRVQAASFISTQPSGGIYEVWASSVLIIVENVEARDELTEPSF